MAFRNSLNSSMKRKRDKKATDTQLNKRMKVIKIATTKTRSKRPPKIWPNVFVAFRVKNEQIITPINEIHDRLRQFSPKFANKLVPTTALHITLMVAKMEQQQFENAKKAMETIGKLIREKEQRFSIDFHGINSFGSRVLYGAVKNECLEPLRGLQKLVVEHFDGHGIQQLDVRPLFQPHLTIARGPRDQQDKDLAEELLKCITEDLVLGQEEINELLLCKMHMNKAKDNFYEILHSEPLILKD